jgi:hypothetical protein
MHHEERSGAPMRSIKRIGKAEIEGAMLDAIRVKLLGRYRIEPLRCLKIALFELWPKPPRPQADRIGGYCRPADEAQLPGSSGRRAHKLSARRCAACSSRSTGLSLAF